MQSVTDIRNRPSISAMIPPVLVPTMRSNTSQGRRLQFGLVCKDNSVMKCSSIRRDEIPRTPPPSSERTRTGRVSLSEGTVVVVIADIMFTIRLQRGCQRSKSGQLETASEPIFLRRSDGNDWRVPYQRETGALRALPNFKVRLRQFDFGKSDLGAWCKLLCKSCLKIKQCAQISKNIEPELETVVRKCQLHNKLQLCRRKRFFFDPIAVVSQDASRHFPALQPTPEYSPRENSKS
jgi:hypothetical protein